MVVIGFVGSEEKWWQGYQREVVVKRTINILKEATKLKVPKIAMSAYLDMTSVYVCSGGCRYGGVDIWAEVIADTLGYPKHIFEPTGDGWNYYRRRNIKIAEDVDILYCFEPEWEEYMGYEKRYSAGDKFCRRSGGIWTMDHARDLDKEVHLEVIPK